MSINTHPQKSPEPGEERGVSCGFVRVYTGAERFGMNFSQDHPRAYSQPTAPPSTSRAYSSHEGAERVVVVLAVALGAVAAEPLRLPARVLSLAVAVLLLPPSCTVTTRAFILPTAGVSGTVSPADVI